MTQSMTAFARAQAELEETSLCWEIRSVNHRYLDVSFRLPEAWRYLENDLRALIRGQVFRGKLECQLKISDKIPSNQSININEGLVDSLLEMTANLAVKKQLQNDVTLSSLLNWPGVVQSLPPDVEKFGQNVLQLFDTALSQLRVVRTTEGNALKQYVASRAELLQEEVAKARVIVATKVSGAKDKLLTRLSSLQLEVDNARVEQEIAIILIRMDVSEELDRLATHNREVMKVLASKDATGRRLDFLMQELNREANTLSSKSDSVELTQSAVEMKVLIEQMREQIQNIE